jgi:hypothetical protein
VDRRAGNGSYWQAPCSWRLLQTVIVMPEYWFIIIPEYCFIAYRVKAFEEHLLSANFVSRMRRAIVISQRAIET